MSNDRNEKDILSTLMMTCSTMNLPDVEDQRLGLPRNPAGRHFSRRDVHAIQGMVFHQELGDGSVEAVAKYHTGPDSHIVKGGTEAACYTWAIRENGAIVLLNRFEIAPWSQGTRDRAGDENAEFMSVMFQGLFKGPHVTGSGAHEPTQEQIIAAVVLWRVCSVAWRWESSGIYGHYHFGKASCPGYTGQELIEVLRKSPANHGKTLEFDLGSSKSRQQALSKLGYTITADGVWGPMSKAMLMAFQKENNLTPDGVWGRETEKTMFDKLKPGEWR